MNNISFLSFKKKLTETFCKWQNEVIGGFNNKNWLGFDISKVGHGYSKKYVGSRFLISVINEQGEVIGILNQTIQNASKGITTMSPIVGDIKQ